MTGGSAGFQLPILAIPAILAIFCGLLPASLSQNPTRDNIFVVNKRQSAFRPDSHRAVETLFRPFSSVLSVFISRKFCPLQPTADSLSRYTHPGVESFVANKSQSALRQPYDNLVEAPFRLRFGFDFTDG
jgi:hypothetical protein